MFFRALGLFVLTICFASSVGFLTPLSVKQYDQASSAPPTSTPEALSCAPSAAQKHHPIAIIAHRGDEQKYVENTFEAFVSAAMSGADYIETDIRQSSDKVFMIHHDHITGRVSECDGGEKEIAHTPWSDLKKDCRYKNVSMASRLFMNLQDFLNVMKKTPAGLVLDVKSEIKEDQMLAFAEELLKLDPHGLCQKGQDPGETFNCFRNIIVYVNDYGAQNRLWNLAKNLEPADPRLHILGNMTYLKILGNPQAAVENPQIFLNNDGIAFKFADASCESLHSMQKLHPEQYLAAWTLESEQEFAQAVALGFDAIVTSKLHDLVKYLKRK